jgi:hypothetical protein
LQVVADLLVVDGEVVDGEVAGETVLIVFYDARCVV